ncbi:MAG TPA: hypothetical protein PK412_02175 [bacterium]|nr:hypothetical protein [bacterium]
MGIIAGVAIAGYQTLVKIVIKKALPDRKKNICDGYILRKICFLALKMLIYD